MSRWRTVAKVGLTVAGLSLAALAGAIFAAGGDQSVPATVADDPSLPAMSVGGVRLHAERFGDPADPVVIVLHGGPGDDYRALLPLQPLADDYRVVFYDQRGAGLSTRVPVEQLGPQDYLDELHGVVEAVSPTRPVHLVGHSWGAMLAAGYLSQHPDRVASAVLAEPGFLTAEASRVFLTEVMASPQVTGTLVKHLAWSALRSLHIDGPDADARADFFFLEFISGAPKGASMMGGYFCDDDPATGHLPHWRFGSTASSAVQALAQGGGDIDLGWDAGLAAFDGPVLLMAGECNRLIGAAHQRAHHLDLFADARLEVISGAGHTMLGEQPEASLAVIRPFLAAASASPEPAAPGPMSTGSAPPQ